MIWFIKKGGHYLILSILIKLIKGIVLVVSISPSSLRIDCFQISPGALAPDLIIHLCCPAIDYCLDYQPA